MYLFGKIQKLVISYVRWPVLVVLEGGLVVIVDDVSLLAKVILIVIYGVVAWNTIVPNSVIMRVASRNAR